MTLDTSVPSVEHNLSASETSASVDAETVSTPVASTEPSPFAMMGLADELVHAVADLGYSEPTQVQLRAIPTAMRGNAQSSDSNYTDLMVSSQTGSGKTAAFLLPVLHTLIRRQADAKAQEKAAFDRLVAQALEKGEEAPKRPKRKNPMNRKFEPAVPGALVLCPTRELAMQVARDAIDLVRHSRGVRIANVIGGLPYPKQIAQLQNADLVVATPGRLLDLQRAGQIVLDQVQFLVIDEADRMLDLGFSEDLEAIHQMTARRQQTMMFSATFASRIQQLGMRIMHDGGKHVQRIEVASAQQKHDNITQKLFWADSPEHKRELLDTWMRNTDIDQAIIFASTQIECDSLAGDLQQAGFSAVALHGALNQGLRMRRLAALRGGQVQFLVATDVAARGIDVPSITHVFNFGLPMKAEDYTHRIGRTGRAGRSGVAISFAEFRDRRRIHDIESFTRQQFEVATLPGLEPRQQFSSWKSGRGAGGPGNGRGQGRGGRPGGGRQGFSNSDGQRRHGHDAPRHFGDRQEQSFGGGRGRSDDRRGNGSFGGGDRGDSQRPSFRGENRGEGRGESARGSFRSEGRGDFRSEGRGEARGSFRPEGRGDSSRGGFRSEGRGGESARGSFRSEGRSDANRGSFRSEGQGRRDFGNAEHRPSGNHEGGRRQGGFGDRPASAPRAHRGQEGGGRGDFGNGAPRSRNKSSRSH